MSVGDPTQPALDTSQGLVSALGGQDVHALEFTGAEIMPTVQGTSLILQDGDEANPDGGPVSWASHPSAIGYRRAGYVSSGSGSGSGGLGGGGGGSGGGSGSGSGSGGGFTTLTAVSPEFDSGMNDGTDGEELDRLQNFYGGTQENPTAAQSAPTPRAQVQVSGTSSGAGMQGSSPGHEPTMTPFFNPETDHGHYNPFVGWLWPFGGGSASGGSQGNAPSTSTTLDYGSPGNSTGTQTMPDPGPPSAPEGAPGGGGGSKAQGPPPGPSPGPGPNSNSNVDPLTALAILAVLSKGSQVNPNPQSNVGPPQPGSVIGPIAPDPYADYIPFSDGQETYLVPPDSVVAVPGRGMIQGATVIHIPGYEEKVARGINIFGAVAGLAGNAVEATGAFFLAITPEPTLLTKVGAGALGVLAADGAQANVRTLWNLGDPTPTMLNQGVTRAAGSVMSPEAARYVGVGTDLATHAGAN